MSSERRMDKATVTRIRLLFLIALAGLFITRVVAANPYGVPDTADVKVYIPSPRDCYFRVVVKNFGDFLGWCVDLDHTINPDTWYTGNLYVKNETGTWGKINWILNHKGSNWKVTQMAIWLVLNYDWSKIDNEMNRWGGYTQSEKDEAENKASSADPNFVPGPGQTVAVYVDPGRCVQKFIFEYPIPPGGGGVPEFGEGFPAAALLPLFSYVILKRRLKAN